MKKEKIIVKVLFAAIVALVFSQATATAAIILPESSFWQGGRNYNENGVSAFVEYAVYDTTAPDYHDVFDGLIDGFPNPVGGTGDYIYAYQVFNLGEDLAPITAFEILGGNPALADGIGSIDDGQGGIIPENDGTTFIWTFETGVFIVDEHSAFMVFTSDAGPVGGDFRITTDLQDYGDEPPVNVPEPATMVLVAAGSCMFLKKRNNN